jgi:hypothetical protein
MCAGIGIEPVGACFSLLAGKILNERAVPFLNSLSYSLSGAINFFSDYLQNELLLSGKSPAYCRADHNYRFVNFTAGNLKQAKKIQHCQTIQALRSSRAFGEDAMLHKRTLENLIHYS